MEELAQEGSRSNRRRREGGAALCWSVARKSLLGLSLAFACQCALAQAMYRIRPVGTLNGWFPNVAAVNEAGQATGDVGQPPHAFLWKHDGTPMVDLGPNEVDATSTGTALNASGLVTGFAYDSTGEFSFVSSGDGTPMKRIYDSFGGSQIYSIAINDLGQLTGYASTAGNLVDHAFVWKGDGSPPHDLGTFGGDFSVAVAINASGQVAGYSDLPGSTTHHAFVWKNDGTPIHDLGTLGGPSSQGQFINASGQVAGTSNMPGVNKKDHAFIWKNDGTPMQDLGTLGGAFSVAVALNDAGQVAGSSYIDPRFTQHAFIWMNNGTPMKDLGTLGGKISLAYDLNSSGQVTGAAMVLAGGASHAFLWRNDGTTIQDLNRLIDPRDPLKRYVELTSGNFINDSGDIMAVGDDQRNGGFEAWYLLHGTVLTLTPRSLAFGNQPINTSSAAKSVTVTNTGSKTVAFAGTALTGTASGQFVVSDNCAAALSAHATCVIQLSLRPTTKGTKRGFLKVNGGDGGLLLVHLTGTGT